MVLFVAKWSTGVKRVGRKTYKVVKMFGAWLILHAGKIVAAFINRVVYVFGTELGKRAARKVFAAA